MAAALGDFFGEIHNSDRTLAFVNRSSPDAVENLLASLFGEQSIPIEDLMVSDERTETVVLLEDGEVIAESTADIADEAEGQTDQIAGINRKMDDLVADLQRNN